MEYVTLVLKSTSIHWILGYELLYQYNNYLVYSWKFLPQQSKKKWHQQFPINYSYINPSRINTNLWYHTNQPKEIKVLKLIIIHLNKYEINIKYKTRDGHFWQRWTFVLVNATSNYRYWQIFLIISSSSSSNLRMIHAMTTHYIHHLSVSKTCT